jgi:hypothetical protein
VGSEIPALGRHWNKVRDFNRNHGSVRVDDSLCKERVQVRETLQQCAVG